MPELLIYINKANCQESRNIFFYKVKIKIYNRLNAENNCNS